MLNNFPNLQKAVINDINQDLINTYKTIASKPNELISILQVLQNEFHELEGKDEQKKNTTTKSENYTTQEKQNKAHRLHCLFFSIELASMVFIE